MAHESPIFDVFIIGGGVNGAGIARDAAGRGLTVALAEKGDLASATSSASSKLFHGGLRYLEYFEFRLVREALIERENLLAAMPHISWPMRFVLPVHRDMRFEADTPTSKLLSALLPWMKGRRPAWLIRLGLFLYDHMGGRKLLPATSTVRLRMDEAGAGLLPRYERAFEYSDCWVDDARLVVLNARDAADRGAKIMTQSEVVSARRSGDLWQIEVAMEDGARKVFQAHALVNAAGPWVADVVENVTKTPTSAGVRLVRGSHIVTRRRFDHDKAYFLQGKDGRIMFALPYEQDYTLFGTTDANHTDANVAPACTDEERDYIIEFANRYLSKPIRVEDVIWTYAGVRSLYDDGADNATAATRDYHLELDETGAPLLSVFGGKITTYRRLAESALAKIAPQTKPWTRRAPLPGGDFAPGEVEPLIEDFKTAYPFVSDFSARRLVRAYGREVFDIYGDATAEQDLGQDFGQGLFAAEVRHTVEKEFVKCAEDILFRRSKLGLRFLCEQGSYPAQKISAFIGEIRN